MESNTAPRKAQSKATKPAPGKKDAGIGASKSKPKQKSTRAPEVKRVTRNPVGRPSSYRPEYADQAMKYALLGANHERMADLFGVAKSTFDLWIANIPEFSDALKEGKDWADANVAKSLYHRALGYSHPEVDIKVINGKIIQTPLIKHYPPDTGAATLWLKNRQPGIWRDKVENVLTGADGGPVRHRVEIGFVKPEPRE